jgi:hypothetical protein
MRYRLYSSSTGEPCDTLEMHVLARAYRAAWRAAHACEPAHCHTLPGLDLLIQFDAAFDDVARSGEAQDPGQAASRRKRARG